MPFPTFPKPDLVCRLSGFQKLQCPPAFRTFGNLNELTGSFKPFLDHYKKRALSCGGRFCNTSQLS